MSRIEYDPVKDKFSAIVRRSKLLRRIFYFLLDLFFLRSWHIRRLIKQYGRVKDKKGEWSLLDAGSGFGQYDRYILSSFKNVTIDAIDVKEDYLEDCRAYFKKEIGEGRISFYSADLLEFNPDKKFDMIICIDVLEHIEEDVKVMNNLSSALKPGGCLIVHSPSHYSEEDGGEEDTFVGEHARPGYSKEELSSKLSSVDLKIDKIHYTYGFFGHKAWVLSVKWPMLWFNKMGLLAAFPLMLYYPVILPVSLLLNVIDLYTANTRGNGIYAVAIKNSQ